MSSRNKNIDIPPEVFETIDRYLSGDMEQAEADEFEKRLLSNSALREQVEEYRILFKGVELGSLKAKLEGFHQELSGKGKKQREKAGKDVFLQWKFARYAAAASVIFFIALGGWLIFNSASEHERLFANYFKPDPGLATVMSSDSDYDFYVGMVDYKRGEYNKAIDQWMPLLDDRPESDTLNYFIGVAHLAAGRETEAISFLQEATERAQSVFLQEAYYYLGLSYLKTGNIEGAKGAFANSPDERSEKILSDLNE